VVSDISLVRELIALRALHSDASLNARRMQYDRAEVSFENDSPPPGPPVNADGCAAEWVLKPPADSVVLYVHGGGYLLGSARSHRHLSAAIGRASKSGVLAVDYRLAPEHPFPAAVEDTVAACRWLLKQNYRVFLAGDSAGGGLVVATLVSVRGDTRRPAGAICLSPWVDLTCQGESHRLRATRDPLLETYELRSMATQYLGGADPRHPLASPIFADLTGLPPMLAMVGSDEILFDDARALVNAWRGAGGVAELQEWAGMIHVWPWWFPVLDEGRRAIAKMGQFITNPSAHAVT